MKFSNKLIYGITNISTNYIASCLTISLIFSSCVRSFGSDYYAQKAYSAFGLKPDKPRNPNIMPYIPGDKKAIEKINNQYTSAGENQSQSMIPEITPSQTPQAQYQPYPLGNTGNYSQPNPSRAVNSLHTSNEYYSTYLKELGKYYNQYAEIFTAKNLTSDAQLLKAKGATAISGNDVMFETENSFDIPLDKKAIITSQRKILENVKSRTDVLKDMPNIVAQMQSSFDCMLIEAKNRIYSQKTICGMAYFQSIGMVEGKFGSMNEPSKQESSLPIDSESTVTSRGAVVNNINIVLGEDVKPHEKSSHYAKYSDEFEDKAVLKYDNHKSFAVYYDVGSFALDASAVYSVNKAIEFTRDYDDYKITVLGFTDRTSSRDYNKVLSEKRATATLEALIKRGIAKEKVQKVLFGEDYNSVTTRDGVGEAFNRRVVIEVDVTGKFDEEEFIAEKGLEGAIVN